MPIRQKRLIFAVGVFLFLVTLAWNLFSGAREATAPVAAPAVDSTMQAVAETTPAPTASPVATPVDDASADLYEYAVAVAELGGLPTDMQAGGTFDLWVTWEPPLTDQPDPRLLLKNVRLLRLVPPVIPDDPVVAILGIPRTREAVRSMLYGDQFGRLSAVTPARAG